MVHADHQQEGDVGDQFLKQCELFFLVGSDGQLVPDVGEEVFKERENHEEDDA